MTQTFDWRSDGIGIFLEAVPARCVGDRGSESGCNGGIGDAESVRSGPCADERSYFSM